MEFSFDNIPQEMREKGLFCCWKYIQKEGREKPDKVPFNPVTHSGASSSDPATFASYETAINAFGIQKYNYTGIGIDIYNGVSVIDLDHCIQDDGTLTPVAEDVVQIMHSYTEISPSGKGLHIFFEAERTKEDRKTYKQKTDEVEAYISGVTCRFLTLTGNRYNNFEFGSRLDELVIVLEKYMKRPARIRLSREQHFRPVTRESFDSYVYDKSNPMDAISDDELLDKIVHSRDGKAFVCLMNGDTSMVKGDDSEADWFLCCLLAKWTGMNPKRMNDIYKRSGLIREKWDEMRGEVTYGEMTVFNAISRREDLLSRTIPSIMDFSEDGDPVPQESISFEGFIEGLKSFTKRDYDATNAPFEYWIDYGKRNYVWCKQLWDLMFNDASEKDADLFDFMMTTGDYYALLQKDENQKSILDLINDAANDITRSDVVTVLSLMCGGGKSTDTAKKILEVLKDVSSGTSTDGLLVVTDSIDRMEGYTKRFLEMLERIERQHNLKVNVMTRDNKTEIDKIQFESPVLIMSTQRYMSLSIDGINSYLTWRRGIRPLVIIDENPKLKAITVIGHKQLNDVTTVLSTKITPLDDQDDKEWCEIQWENIIKKIKKTMSGLEQLYDRPFYYLYYEFRDRSLTEDDSRFFQIIERHKQQLKFGIDAYSTIMAVKKLINEGGIYSVTKTQKHYDSYFSVMIDNTSKFSDVNAKVIILDGTASITPEYFGDPRIEVINAVEHDRILDFLSLVFFDVTTSKAKFREDHDGTYLRAILKSIVRLSPMGYDTPVFTYQEEEKAVKSFGLQCDHFGNIIGKNDYLNDPVIAQVGLNQFPPINYVGFDILQNAELIASFKQILADSEPAEENSRYEYHRATYDFIDQKIAEFLRDNDNSAVTQAAKILVDLEQNMFRGTIRNASNTDPYTYLVYCEYASNTALFELANHRYRRLHGKVYVKEETPFELKLWKTSKYKGKHKTKAQIALEYINSVPLGVKFTQKDIRDATSLTERDMKKILGNKPGSKYSAAGIKEALLSIIIPGSWPHTYMKPRTNLEEEDEANQEESNDNGEEQEEEDFNFWL